MLNRLILDDLTGGRVGVSFRRAGQAFDEIASAPAVFASALTAGLGPTAFNRTFGLHLHRSRRPRAAPIPTPPRGD
jgi:hypothetical protein